jgi:hypothetical protein
MSKRENRINAVIVEVGKLPRLVKVENSLEAFQSLVGGYIEVVRMENGVDAIINEEGKLEDLEPNIALMYEGKMYDYIAGTAVLVAHDSEGETVSLTQQQVSSIQLQLIGERA